MRVDAYSAMWAKNPEPDATELDGTIILDTGMKYDAYLWASMNSSEGWLAYDGPMVDIEQ